MAAVDVDGSVYGAAVRTPVSRPLMFVVHEGLFTSGGGDFGPHPTVGDTWRAHHGPGELLELGGTVHASFMDFKQMVELLDIDVPQDGVNASLGSMEPDRMREIVGGAVTRFFDTQLRAGSGPQVSDYAQTLPEVTFEHK